MTTPTPAQIEAAGCTHEFWEREASVATEGYCPICMAERIAALTAAAEAGGSIPESSLKKMYDLAWNRAIERCAQVADEFVDDTDPDSIAGRIVRDLAAAIRALKDKP